jgi:hypothetical protein
MHNHTQLAEKGAAEAAAQLEAQQVLANNYFSFSCSYFSFYFYCLYSY